MNKITTKAGRDHREMEGDLALNNDYVEKYKGNNLDGGKYLI